MDQSKTFYHTYYAIDNLGEFLMAKVVKKKFMGQSQIFYHIFYVREDLGELLLVEVVKIFSWTNHRSSIIHSMLEKI